MELAIAGSIAGTAEVVQPRQHRQQAVKVFETAQIPLGEIGFLGCPRPPPVNMIVLSCCRKQRANSVANRCGMSPFASPTPNVGKEGEPSKANRCLSNIGSGKSKRESTVKTPSYAEAIS